MKNKLTDLHNHLFAQVERLSNESLTEAELDKEIRRGKTISEVSESIIKNARLVFDVQRFIHDEDPGLERIPAFIEARKDHDL